MADKKNGSNIPDQKLENVTGGQISPNPKGYDYGGAEIMKRQQEAKQREAEERQKMQSYYRPER